MILLATAVLALGIPDPHVGLEDALRMQQVVQYNAVVQWHQAEAKAAEPRVVVRPSPTPKAGHPLPPATGSCANPVISEATARRESGCNWNAWNPTGCSGRGCWGFYQEDLGHYSAHSPWNPSVPGSCYGLDRYSHEGQTECAQRLGPGAWG